MILRILVSAIFIAGIGGRFARADDAAARATEETLAAVLRWEVLWDDSPRGFRLPSDGVVTLAISAEPGSATYCSHLAGVCVKYWVSSYRNWEGVTSIRCDDARSDEDALLAFLGREPRRPAGNRERPLTVGPGGLSGVPVAGTAIWTARVALGSRPEIVAEYRQIHPAEIGSLEKWLGGAKPRDAGVKAITVACFAPTDPVIYYYIDRPVKASVVMAVFWDKERQDWTLASSLERAQGPERFDEMHRIIESVACSTIVFQ